jgi:formate dehydrogenase iron-sulfur subunit
MNRRGFLQLAGAVAGGAVAGDARRADAATTTANADWAVLVDLTRCIGCRSCEAACAEANALPEPDWTDDFSYAAPRPVTEGQWTSVNRFDTSQGEVFVKRQCMHCVEPACAAGCLTKALYKTDEGPVVWAADRCMGCRYCMISCPFDMPRFEYASANPRITKCQMCHQKVREEGEGAQPACVENCPAEALTFGPRDELLEIARERIYQNPGEYVSHVYGEHEVGGTGWLYISPVPFDELGFRTDLGTESYPEKTRGFLTAVPLVLLLWPAFLMALRRATGREEDAGAAGGGHLAPSPPAAALETVPFLQPATRPLTEASDDHLH